MVLQGFDHALGGPSRVGLASEPRREQSAVRLDERLGLARELVLQRGVKPLGELIRPDDHEPHRLFRDLGRAMLVAAHMYTHGALIGAPAIQTHSLVLALRGSLSEDRPVVARGHVRPGLAHQLAPQSEALGHQAHEMKPSAEHLAYGVGVHELTVGDDGDLAGVGQERRELGQQVPVGGLIGRVPAAHRHRHRDPHRSMQRQPVDELLQIRAFVLGESVGGTR